MTASSLINIVASKGSYYRIIQRPNNMFGTFVVSTYNTDYILVKAQNFGKAMDVLEAAGYTIV